MPPSAPGPPPAPGPPQQQWGAQPPQGWGAQPYGAPPSSTGRYAGFWIRLLGYIIDNVLVGAVTFGIIKATGVITVLCPAGITDPSNPACGKAMVSGGFYAILAIPVLYFIVGWAFGGTLGQRLLGLRVVNASTGGNLGVGRAVLRYIGQIVATVIIYIGLIWIAFDSRKQGWHDKIAGSFVIHTR